MIWYHARHSLNIKIIKKLHLTVKKGAGCCLYPCDVTSSSAVNLTTDSYQFCNIAHLKLQVTFQSHVRFARKVQKCGDAFSKSSSIDRIFLFRAYDWRQANVYPVMKNAAYYKTRICCKTLEHTTLIAY